MFFHDLIIFCTFFDEVGYFFDKIWIFFFIFFGLCLVFFFFFYETSNLLAKLTSFSWPFDKIHKFFMMFWQNSHFICNLCSQNLIFCNSLGRILFMQYLHAFCDLLTKFAYYLRCLDDICIFFTIFWLNVWISCDHLMKFVYF